MTDQSRLDGLIAAALRESVDTVDAAETSRALEVLLAGDRRRRPGRPRVAGALAVAVALIVGVALWIAVPQDDASTPEPIRPVPSEPASSEPTSAEREASDAVEGADVFGTWETEQTKEEMSAYLHSQGYPAREIDLILASPDYDSGTHWELILAPGYAAQRGPDRMIWQRENATFDDGVLTLGGDKGWISFRYEVSGQTLRLEFLDASHRRRRAAAGYLDYLPGEMHWATKPWTKVR